MSLTLASEVVALTVLPRFGARVVSLMDRRSGRDWLVQGDAVGDAGDGACYLGAEARGWDECFPTVAPCDRPEWGGALRDHGMLWGRPAVASHGADWIETEQEGPGWRFTRRLTLSGAVLRADYEVTNTSASALPYLYSQHCLLALTPADRISLAGLTAHTEKGLGFDWPRLSGADLSRPLPESASFAAKTYATVDGAALARVDGPKGGLSLEWAGGVLSAFGFWASYGGWPDGAPVTQVALEPTTSPADSLADARVPRILRPGATDHWTITLTLHADKTGADT